MLKYQVVNPQRMAPETLAKITTCVILFASTMLLPMVAATFVEIMAPTKFNTAAMIMALFIDRALVETQVAIAFAVSLKPLI